MLDHRARAAAYSQSVRRCSQTERPVSPPLSACGAFTLCGSELTVDGSARAAYDSVTFVDMRTPATETSSIRRTGNPDWHQFSTSKKGGDAAPRRLHKTLPPLVHNQLASVSIVAK